MGEGEPVPVVGEKLFTEKGLVGTDGNGVALHILSADIYRLTHSKPQTLTLAQCVAHCTLVLTYDFSIRIQKIAGRIVLARIALQKCFVISIGNKTNILAVTLSGVDKALLGGDLPNLCFGKSA